MIFPERLGIVAVFEEQWVADVSKALKAANNVSKHEVDRQSVAAAQQHSRPGHRRNRPRRPETTPAPQRKSGGLR